MIKKLNYVELVIQALIVLLFASCLWVLPLRRTPNFWVSFVFAVISLVTYIFLSSQWAKKAPPSEKFLHLIYPVGSIFIFLIQTAWNLFVLFVSTLTLENVLGMSKDALFEGSPFQGLPVKSVINIVSYMTEINILDIKVINISIPLNIIVNLICTIVYVIIIYWMVGSVKEIRKIDIRVKTSTSFVKGMEIELHTLAQTPSLGAGMKDKLEMLAEKVKYSDPVSSGVLENIENDIRAQMDKLSESIFQNDHEKITVTINTITALLDQRNLLCKNSK